jgi:hypothetical protein
VSSPLVQVPCGTFRLGLLEGFSLGLAKGLLTWSLTWLARCGFVVASGWGCLVAGWSLTGLDGCFVVWLAG